LIYIILINPYFSFVLAYNINTYNFIKLYILIKDEINIPNSKKEDLRNKSNEQKWMMIQSHISDRVILKLMHILNI